MKKLLSLFLLGLTLSQLNAQVFGDRYSGVDNNDGEFRITPITPPTKNLCEQNFEDNGYKYFDYVCRYNISWSKREISRVKWDDYFACLNNNENYLNRITGLATKCYNQWDNKYLSSDDVHACVAKLKKIDAVFSSINDCFNTTTGKNIVKDTFDKCYEVIKDSNQSTWSKVNTCASDNGQEKTTCWDTAKDFIGDKYAMKRCTDYHTRKAVNGYNFKSCMGKNKKLALTKYSMFEICIDPVPDDVIECIYENNKLIPTDLLAKECSDYDFRKDSDDRDFKSCLKVTLEDLNQEDSLNFCKENYDDYEDIDSRDFKTCKNKLLNYGVSLKTAYGTCIDSSVSGRMEDKEYSACVAKGFSATLYNYLELRQNELDERNKNNQSRRISKKYTEATYYIFSDCKSDHSFTIFDSEYDNSFLKLYADYNIHSNTVFEKNNILIGGLSALRFNEETKKMYLLSDDRGFKGDPRIYVYDYSFNKYNKLEIKEDKLIFFNKQKKTKKAGPIKTTRFSMDPEGFDFTENGEIIVASELDDLGGNEFISKFTADGQIIENIDINDAFRPKSVTNRVCKDYEVDRYDHYGSDQAMSIEDELMIDRSRNTSIKGPKDSDDRSSSRSRRHHRPTGKVCTHESYKTGLQSNKSFESLNLSPDKQYLFTANEAALHQDKRFTKWFNNKIVDRVRIVKYKKEDGKFKEIGHYFYELENEPDNGLVEILSLTDDIVLTLERSWDSFKKRITARIFLVNLSQAENMLGQSDDSIADAQNASKQLVLDLDDIKSEMAPGYRRLDNFEGMSFGPVLPNGKKSIALTVDNNFNLNQRSMIVFLEADIEGLIKKAKQVKQVQKED